MLKVGDPIHFAGYWQDFMNARSYPDERRGLPLKAAPSLRKSVGGMKRQTAEKVLDYVRSGDVPIAQMSGWADDPLEDHPPAKTPSDPLPWTNDDLYVGDATDGVWVWPRYLSYFIARYRVTLPKAFVTHAVERIDGGSRGPAIPRERMDEIMRVLGWGGPN